MKNLKKILYATDFSDNSKEAMDYAVGLAKKFAAQLILLHVVETFGYAPPEYYMTEEDLRKEVARRSEDSYKQLDKMAEEAKGVKTECG